VLNATGEEAAGQGSIARLEGRTESVKGEEKKQEEEEGGDEVDLDALDTVAETEEVIERSWGGRENVPAAVWRKWREEMLFMVRVRRQWRMGGC
jgi:hypothetical protein